MYIAFLIVLGGLGLGLLAVDRTRQRRLARAAACFLAERALEDRLCRFDVVAVGRGPDATAEVLHHVPCAFWCDR
ncbi:MAG: hypothetical protein D6776_05385 [Planctomycetota bacterium]|nr:MAG: hypothetical protein D6776_05385 [Planctomycetota bacterium]